MNKRNVLTCTGGGGSSSSGKSVTATPKARAFTMAEILLSLTIIGVVAAITLPSLTGNINERTWNTQRKALYARFSQAIALMPALNGYGTFVVGDESTSAVDTAAETFVTSGLAKVLKINNICDNTHLTDCGIVESYTNLAASKKAMPKNLSELNRAFVEDISDIYGSYKNPQHAVDTKAAAFETQNGESILVFYNPICNSYMGELGYYSQTKMCANFIYDLNGSKGPNTVGKDIGFMSVLYPTDSVVVAPNPINTNVSYGSYSQAVSYCRGKDADSRIPTIDELASIFYNSDLVGVGKGDHYWSGSRHDSERVYYLRMNSGKVYVEGGGASRTIRCVRR